MPKRPLTDIQWQALRTVASREPEPTFSSTSNGATFIARSAARRLEALGFIQAEYRPIDRQQRWPMWHVTAAGADVLAVRGTV